MEVRPRVLQVLYSGLGGHGSVVFSLIKGDLHRQWNHFLIFYGVEDLKKDYEEYCRLNCIPFLFIKKSAGLDIGAIKNIRNFIRKNSIDYVLLHSTTLIPFLTAPKYFSRYKVILVEHTPNQSKTKTEWMASLWGNLFAFKTVYLTDQYRSEVKSSLGPAFKLNRTYVIPNGIDTTYFYPSTHQNNESITISMVGRFSHTKDQATLIKACKFLKEAKCNFNFRLILAGDGDCLDSAKRLALELSITNIVDFKGSISESEIVILLKQTDIYVHSSFSETMSTSIMQAMACGLPIIASNVSGISNMLSHEETALLVRTADVGMLGEALIELITNMNKRVALGENARNYAVANFSNQTMFRRYNGLLD